MTTDQQLYEQWRAEYALAYEPNYDEHLDADCRAAFFAGMRAERGAKVVPDAYLVYAKGSTRYWVVTLNPDDVPEIYKGGKTVPLYRRANAQNPPQAEQCQSCRTGSPYACTCPFKTDRNSDPSCFETAPVQLPEPAACIAGNNSVAWNTAEKIKFGVKLYTEHQVIELLKRN